MKTIILTRHAKSDWGIPGQADYDRPLNARGKSDAPMMGARLAKKPISVDLLISSTAKRAAETAILIAHELTYNTDGIQWLDRLYHAKPRVIQDVILETDDNHNTILIVCHNNGITEFANSLSGTVTADMPTCAMMAFTIDIESWKDFPLAKKTLLFYDYPKNMDH